MKPDPDDHARRPDAPLPPAGERERAVRAEAILRDAWCEVAGLAAAERPPAGLPGLIECLLAGDAAAAQARLFALADAARRAGVGDEVHLRALVEYSSHCRQDCLYCGLRQANAAPARYRLSRAEILATARAAADLGYGTIVLQAGEDPRFPPAELASLVAAVKGATGLAVTLSAGVQNRAACRRLAAAGLDRYLLKHETADPCLHAALRPGNTLAARLACLADLRAAGVQIGSGMMVGLPGQTLAVLARDVHLLWALDVDMAGIGPFIPHPATPLGGAPRGDLALTLRAVAITRLLLPRAHLPATTAVEVVKGAAGGRLDALRAGANVIMPNLTPPRYRALYQIYPNLARLAPEDPLAARRQLERALAAAGRPVAGGPGHSFRQTTVGEA